MDDAQLRTVWQQRQSYKSAVPLAEPLTCLMKQTLARRVRQVGRMSIIWDEVIPDEILEHTALESLSRGVLTVKVDSSSHRFRLRTLLNSGILHEIRSRFNGPLDSIRLVPGQFDSVEVF